MDDFDYDYASVDSIVDFSRELTGKSLSEAAWHPESIANIRNRGNLGSLVENFFFGINPGSSPLPDFPQANLELKVTGLLRRSNNQYRAKERLVLSMIHYSSIVGEEWESSALLRKCRLMLVLFYLYETDVPVTQLRFVLPPMLLNLTEQDAEVIQRDWEFIRDKVRSGLAHELSEGDTFYLGACRKGAGGEGEKLQSQPFSETKAKSRAFSLKQTYLTQLVERHSELEASLVIRAGQTIDEATRARFEPYLGMKTDEIAQNLGVSASGKGFWRSIANRILTDSGKEPIELKKAGIEMKTIRLRSTGMPREAMSFPNFSYTGILDEDWEDSSFFERIERKFLFVVFATGNDQIERLSKVAYWNMPFDDRLEAKSVWEETRRRVAVDASNLPLSGENRVAHVRPKARNRNDTELTPQGTKLVRKCFWLNQKYIRDVISAL